MNNGMLFTTNVFIFFKEKKMLFITRFIIVKNYNYLFNLNDLKTVITQCHIAQQTKKTKIYLYIL